MMREESLFLTNQSLNYAEGPNHGPPLILLHGVLRQWADYASVLAVLTSRWHVFGIDFRGHGKSSRLPDQYFVADYMRDVATFINNQLRQPAVIYGHSLGAMTAVHVAAEMREHVKAIVLEDPPFQTMGSRIRETQYFSQFSGILRLMSQSAEVRKLAADLAELPIDVPGKDTPLRFGDLRDPAALRWFAACLSRVDPAIIEPIVEGRWLEGFDVDRLIQRIRCPTLLLQADSQAGGMLTDEDAGFMQRTIRDCARIRFPGVGHSIRWSAFEPWQRVVLNFLESVR
jgi:pimeloyl-ACP methyl ester carboxylesterase